MNIDFEKFYLTWYSRAKFFAKEYVVLETISEDIVQDVFIHLYERQDILDGYANPVAYLFTSIKNKSLDYLRKRIAEDKARIDMQSEFELSLQMKCDSLEILNTNFPDEEGIKKILNKALQSLPERCRDIFIMNKIEGKKQKEIADELRISVNTVESQMAVAYKKLREELKDYIPLLVFILPHLIK